jgi:phage terminase large subunit-like protein
VHDFPKFAQDCGVELEPFQKRIYRAATGPEPEFLALIPRGAGKTSLTALIALHHLITVEDAAVYISAASREQARIMFRAATDYARRLDHPNVIFRHDWIRWCPDPEQPKVYSRFINVTASNAPLLHGLTYSLACIDEYQAHSTSDVYVAIASALHKRPGAKLITISTAGQGADSPLAQLRQRALGLADIRRRGYLTDARGGDLRMLEWAVPTDADVDNPRIVKKANPPSWITVDGIRRARAMLPPLEFERFIANRWVERAGHWLPAPDSWQRCIGEPEFTDGEKVVVAVDMGGEISTTAVVWINESLQVQCEIAHGDHGILDAAEIVRELAERYRIVELTFDPMRAVQLAQELGERGLRVSDFPQSDARMIPASKRLYDAIVQKRLTLPDNDELRQHSANTIARHSRRGWRVDKPNLRTPNDGVVALAMALDRLENRPPPPPLPVWVDGKGVAA